MATAAGGAAVDVLALIVVTLAAYQQQQQRSLAVWNLIMDGYEDDTEELDAENDESTREIKRRRVYQRKDYKTSGWWQELQNKDLSDHTSRAAWRFRGDYRLLYCFFEELVVLVKQKRLVLLQTKIIRTTYSVVVFAEFYRIRSTGRSRRVLIFL